MYDLLFVLTISNMESKENISVVIMDRDKAKVVALNSGPSTPLESKQSIHGNGVSVQIIPVADKLVSVSLYVNILFS